MIKKLLVFLAKKLSFWLLKKLFNHIDSNNDRKLSQEEIEEFGRELMNLGKRIKNRAF